MPRPKTIPQNQFPYFITGRCANKEWFSIPLEEVWEVFERHLFMLVVGFRFRIHAFVLMGNHFHMLASTPDSNIGDGMQYLMNRTSIDITYQSGRINQTYGGPYHRCILSEESHFLNAYKYIYRNPVKAGIAERCEDYRFSTLRGILGLQHTLIPIECDYVVLPDISSGLRWLNSNTEKDETEVARALAKGKYQYMKSDKRLARTHNFIY